MRDPPLTTIEAIDGYLPRERGEPPQARVSLEKLYDMHEAMYVEEEMERRAHVAAELRAKRRQPR